ncbi:hypothetical protein AN958_01298 [Leucoagaricus sp. SymC.cos]|nr:hypothetical protein AN958_01298 [Leucoagaricus sp. SymC.cos]
MAQPMFDLFHVVCLQGYYDGIWHEVCFGAPCPRESYGLGSDEKCEVRSN